MKQSNTDSTRDEWGFYQVGAYKTYSKLDAIEKSAATSTPFKWNFNNDEFSAVDWTVDPPGNLDFWYAQRARQLRDKYDHLTLMYSGGADSTNMLRVFSDNNIYIDEVAMFFVLEGTPNHQKTEVNEETFSTAIPTAKKILEQNPIYKTTKFTLIDAGTNFVPLVKSCHTFDYWYNESNFLYSPWGRVAGNLRTIHTEWQDLAASKKMCLVWGFDKPRIECKQNQWYAQFTEGGLSAMVSPNSQQKNRAGEYDEMFYWSKHLPQLVIKQCHAVMNYTKRVTIKDIDNFHLRSWNWNKQEQQTRLSVSGFSLKFVKDELGYELTEHGLHRLIYKNWNPFVIVTPKTPSPFFSTKDDWLWQSNVEQAVPRWYQYGAVWMRQHVNRVMPSAWFEFPSRSANQRYSGGLKPIKIEYSLQKQH